MNIHYIGKITLEDNELQMFDELFKVIKHADPEPDITIDRKPEFIIVHIHPSNLEFRQHIIDNILYINRQRRQYRIHFSKSLAVSKVISFTISNKVVEIEHPNKVA